jgi:carboxyl-terminal processing protease
MRQRVTSLGLRALLAVGAILLAVPAVAQLTTITIRDPRGEIDELLRRGQQLELQRRWGEALAHYEGAVRRYPQETSLHARFDFARLHYDLDRRYADRSFCDLVVRLSPERALALYNQVLLKIESHYVDPPRWKTLVERGAGGLWLALGEKTFVERNVPERFRPAVEAFRRDLLGLASSETIDNREAARRCVTAAARLAQQRLDVAPAVVVLEYLCGATNALDAYSAYLTSDQLNEVYAQIEGNFVGLGVELKSIEGRLTIVRVITGSPAEESGVRAGDRILSIDGRPIANLSTEQAANMLQGPDGSVVALTVAAPGQQPRPTSVRRRVVEVPSIDQVAIIDPQQGIGYFKLTCFQKTTARDLDAALWKLHREGMQSLVIDVRGNPGGSLPSVVEVADRFIERGIIVSTRGRSPQEDFTYVAHEQPKWRMPLVVIIDQDSASAAEILAGAIRDHHRGTIVGVRSFGKGTVQGIFPLEDESRVGVRLTTSKFYSPNGRPFSGVGVDPDPVQQAGNVHVTAKPIDGKTPIEEEKDATLVAALEAVRSLSQSLQARKAP